MIFLDLHNTLINLRVYNSYENEVIKIYSSTDFIVNVFNCNLLNKFKWKIGFVKIYSIEVGRID